MSHTRVVESCDVLVVGGGLAALQAAIAAADEGAKTIIVSKRRVAKSGCSAMTSAGIAAVMPGLVPDDDVEHHIVDTYVGGYTLADPELLRALCSEAPERIRELDERGGLFAKSQGVYKLSGSGDHSRVRSLGAEHHRGTDFTLPLAAHAERGGVEVRDHLFVLDLLRDDAAVTGSVCMTADGSIHLIHSRATILATGGAGELFPVSSNPKEIAGDGYSLALRAGAEVRDLEFIQFYPWRCVVPFTNSRVAVQPATFVHGGQMYNADGQRFMADYDADRMEATTRDVAARAIYDQVRLGRGINGGVRLSLAEMSEADFRETNPKMAAALPRYTDDYTSYPFILSPEAHYSMGGVRIDVNGQSTVPGLYAVGEVSGGIQGANRLSNNALSEALVFGVRAGVHAAHRTDGRARTSETVATDWERHLDHWASIAAGGTKKLRTEVQQTASDSLGIVRTRGALDAGAAGMQRLCHRAVDEGAEDPGAATMALETLSLIRVAECALIAATAREESRGAHFREDFPEQDDNEWACSLGFQQDPAPGPTGVTEPMPLRTFKIKHPALGGRDMARSGSGANTSGMKGR